MTKADTRLPHLVAVATLKGYERNARTHSDAQIEQVKESIRRFGFISPLAYDEKGLAIGHGRQRALMEMWAAGETVMGPGRRDALPEGMAPAIDVSGLSDNDRRALILADNQIALNSGWDEELLKAELAELAAADYEMPIIGFDFDSLNALLNPVETETSDATADAAARRATLADEFMIPPFSVLNAREGWWQNRKRAWLALGIRSEVGRGENEFNAAPGGSIMVSGYDADGKRLTGLKSQRQSGKAMAQNRAENGESAYLKGALTVEVTADVYRKRGSNGRAKAAPMGQDLLKGEGSFDVGKAKAVGTTEWMQDKGLKGGCSDGDEGVSSGTSIFDPVMCELAYRWFSPKGGTILDPFAGGSVRGIVAAALGRKYVGIDLRREQIEANDAQWPGVAALLNDDGLTGPRWYVGDSSELLSAANEGEDDVIGDGYDMIFSCPPYGDLEVYSDDPQDISTMTVAEFDAAYDRIIRRAVARLANDRFACFVVGDYRDKKGIYANFVSKTIAAFENAGARLYNEAILVTCVGSLPIRAAKQFRTTRKMGKTHQNILTFIKGDARKAVAALGPVDVSASIADIEPDEGA